MRQDNTVYKLNFSSKAQKKKSKLQKQISIKLPLHKYFTYLFL